MKVTQIAALVNSITNEIIGETAVLNDDLSNVVDIGKEIINTDNLDNYVKKLVNHIGKVIFVNRIYQGGAPSVLMDSWEFGSILEKISAELPTATESDSWKLTNGTDYSPNVFYQPTVSAKFFNSKTTFEIPLSFTEMQVKESFSSAEQLNGFISMLQNAVDNAMTVKVDGLIMRTINNFMGEVIDSGKETQKVNLLAAYNAAYSETLTADNAIINPDFIRFACYQIAVTSDRMTKISQLFNADGKTRFTPKDMQKIVFLSDFGKAAQVFLQSDLNNKELVTLPDFDAVPYWQGSGENYGFDSTSKIDVKTASGETVTQSGILGIIFDRDALGVTNLDKRVTTNYNPKAEFYTNFYKCDSSYFNDLGENFVMFYVADTVTP